jgi:hypothetical protein
LSRAVSFSWQPTPPSSARGGEALQESETLRPSTDNPVSRTKAYRERLALLTLLGAAALLGGCNSNAQEGEAVAEAAPACNRACVIETTNDHIAAVVAHQRPSVRLAQDVAIVEDLKQRLSREGLWQTATPGRLPFPSTCRTSATRPPAGWA